MGVRGMAGFDAAGDGVRGETGGALGNGVHGLGRYGVLGEGNYDGAGAGVRGDNGLGVIGVWGNGSGAGSDGVRAEGAAGATALQVIGPAHFSTGGTGVVPVWADAATVDNPAVTAHSHITLTFTGDPGRASLAWVERRPGAGFVVHLTNRLHGRLSFTFLILETNTVQEEAGCREAQPLQRRRCRRVPLPLDHAYRPHAGDLWGLTRRDWDSMLTVRK